MPRWIRLTALWGNGIAAAIWLVVTVVAITRNGGAGLFTLASAALAGFNLYVVAKAAHLLSEEEWLKAEIRKAELRRELARLQEEASDPQAEEAPPLALPGPDSRA